MEIFRLFLAYCVVVSHLDSLNGTQLDWFRSIGGIAVNCFFILSGYIIPKTITKNYLSKGIVWGNATYLESPQKQIIYNKQQDKPLYVKILINTLIMRHDV